MAYLNPNSSGQKKAPEATFFDFSQAKNPADTIFNLRTFVRSFKIEASNVSDKIFLIAPDYNPIPVHFSKKRLIPNLKKKRWTYGEVTTIAAMSYFFDRANIKTFLDVGAGQGYFSELALNYKRQLIDVFAFEMQPEQHKKLSNNLLKYATSMRGVECLHSGLTDRHIGQKQIWYSQSKMFEEKPDQNYYKEKTLTRLKFLLKGIRNRDRLCQSLVELTSIDHYCNKKSIDPDMIKIDVDGYEANVIRGSLETLLRCKPIIFLELHRTKFIEKLGLNRREIVEPLFDLGYECCLIDNHYDIKSKLFHLTIDDPEILREQTDMFIFF